MKHLTFALVFGKLFLRTSLVLSGVLFAVCCSTHRTDENSGKPNAASEKVKPEVSQNAGEAQTGPATQSNPSRFRFLGRVLDERGNAAAKESLMFSEVTRNGLTISFGKEGRLEQPTATTDAEGRFVIEVDPGFLKKGKDYTISAAPTVGLNSSLARRPLMANAKRLVIKSSGEQPGDVDLGDLVLK